MKILAAQLQQRQETGELYFSNRFVRISEPRTAALRFILKASGQINALSAFSTFPDKIGVLRQQA